MLKIQRNRQYQEGMHAKVNSVLSEAYWLKSQDSHLNIQEARLQF